MPEIRLGAGANMEDIRLGSTQIEEVRLGAELVWRNNALPAVVVTAPSMTAMGARNTNIEVFAGTLTPVTFNVSDPDSMDTIQSLTVSGPPADPSPTVSGFTPGSNSLAGVSFNIGTAAFRVFDDVTTNNVYTITATDNRGGSSMSTVTVTRSNVMPPSISGGGTRTRDAFTSAGTQSQSFGLTISNSASGVAANVDLQYSIDGGAWTATSAGTLPRTLRDDCGGGSASETIRVRAVSTQDSSEIEVGNSTTITFTVNPPGTSSTCTTSYTLPTGISGPASGSIISVSCSATCAGTATGNCSGSRTFTVATGYRFTGTDMASGTCTPGGTIALTPPPVEAIQGTISTTCPDVSAVGGTPMPTIMATTTGVTISSGGTPVLNPSTCPSTGSSGGTYTATWPQITFSNGTTIPAGRMCSGMCPDPPLFTCAIANLRIADGNTGNTISPTVSSGTIATSPLPTYTTGTNVSYTLAITPPASGYSNSGGANINCSDTASASTPIPTAPTLNYGPPTCTGGGTNCSYSAAGITSGYGTGACLTLQIGSGSPFRVGSQTGGNVNVNTSSIGGGSRTLTYYQRTSATGTCGASGPSSSGWSSVGTVTISQGSGMLCPSGCSHPTGFTLG